MNILVFFVELPYATPAIRLGGQIAGALKGSITLLYIRGEGESPESADQVINQAKSLLSGEVKAKIEQKKPVQAVLDEIEQQDYQIVVLMARHALRFRERIREKIGRKIARTAPISVLVVKREQPGLERILICTGGQKYSEPVVQLGVQIAAGAGASATVMHVTNPLPLMYTGLDTMEETLDELLQTETPTAQHLRWAAGMLEDLQVEGSVELRRGDVVDEILQQAEAGDHDLLVIGASLAASQLRQFFLSDVTWDVVNLARCPVLVVRRVHP